MSFYIFIFHIISSFYVNASDLKNSIVKPDDNPYKWKCFPANQRFNPHCWDRTDEDTHEALAVTSFLLRDENENLFYFMTPARIELHNCLDLKREWISIVKNSKEICVLGDDMEEIPTRTRSATATWQILATDKGVSGWHGETWAKQYIRPPFGTYKK